MKKKCILYLFFSYVLEAILLILREFRDTIDEEWGIHSLSIGGFLFLFIVFLILLVVPFILTIVLVNVSFSLRIKTIWRNIFEYILYVWLLLPNVAYFLPIVIEYQKCAMTPFGDVFFRYTFNVYVLLLLVVKLGTIMLIWKQIRLYFSHARENL
ncbi:MAG: hypothetical protein U0K66_03180 [Paludibacteraceae bacterium]|nr:hypothetical protein [Paludibacteraceae bacterium]